MLPIMLLQFEMMPWLIGVTVKFRINFGMSQTSGQLATEY